MRLAPKPKPKYDTKSGKWVVMNWDGTVAGIEGGDQIKFIDMSRQVSGLTEPTMGSDRTNTSSLHSSDVAEMHSSQRDDLHQVQEAVLRPFARVNTVAADSPAEGAGLKEEDLIVRFGHLDADNHDHLKAIAALVPEVAGEGGEVKIDILRRPKDFVETTAIQDVSNATVGASTQTYNDPSKWEKLTVSLAPRPWSGRGLIGKEHDKTFHSNSNACRIFLRQHGQHSLFVHLGCHLLPYHT
jgi:hypothetical protein